MNEKWTDAALVFSAEVQLQPEDADARPTEFFLTAQDFDTLCPVLAKELAPGQLNPSRSLLPSTLPPRANYTVTWVSHVHCRLIFVGCTRRVVRTGLGSMLDSPDFKRLAEATHLPPMTQHGQLVSGSTSAQIISFSTGNLARISSLNHFAAMNNSHIDLCDDVPFRC